MIGYGTENTLLALSVAIGILFVLVLAFVAVVFYLHARNERRGFRFAELEARWEPPMLDALVQGAGAFPVAALVHRRDRMHFVWFLVRFARRLRGAERAVLEELAAPCMEEVAARARRGSPEVRARALQTLTTLGMPQHADIVVAALDDDSPLVSMTAARALARREHAQFAPQILARIDRFSHWHERFLAAMLGSIGDAAAPALRDTLADSTVTPQGRAIAAQALAQLRDLPAAGIAVAILRTETDRNLLGAALTLLAAVGHEQHLRDVLDVLLASQEAWVRAQALETLAQLGTRADAHILLEALHDESPWVALRAAYGLAEIGATDELIRLRASDGRIGDLAREVLSRGAA